MNVVEETRQGGLNAVNETKLERQKVNETTFEQMLKHTKKVYNVILSLTKYWLSIENKRKKTSSNSLSNYTFILLYH